MSKKLLLSAGMIFALIGVSACSDSADENTADNAPEQEAPEQGDVPQPDLEGIPDVVAEVNGSEIDKDEFARAYESQFQQMAMQAQMTGEEVDEEQLKSQTADNLVNTELLIQEADDRGLAVSDEDLDETLSDLAEQNGLGSADEFIDALGEQGMDREDVMAQLEIQVKIDRLLEDETGDVEPTEEELRELYDQAVAQQEEMGDDADIPPFEDVKPQLEEEAKANKEGEAAQALVTDLRESADITIHLQ